MVVNVCAVPDTLVDQDDFTGIFKYLKTPSGSIVLVNELLFYFLFYFSSFSAFHDVKRREYKWEYS